MIHGLGTFISPLTCNTTCISAVSYRLRNSDDLQIPFSRTNIYENSFLPSVVRDWNQLPPHVRNTSSVASFKRLISFNSHTKTPDHFYTGTRKLQNLHTRLRTGCSSLNDDLFSKGIVDTALCQCGMVENVYQFSLTVHCTSIFDHSSLTQDYNTLLFP